MHISSWVFKYLQETKLTPLIFTKMILALDSLQAGGFLILKTFPLFHCYFLSLCYYLSQVFDSVHTAKCIACKAGSCKIHLACIAFRAFLPRIHHQLVALVTSRYLMSSLSSKCMFPRELTHQVPSQLSPRHWLISGERLLIKTCPGSRLTWKN